MIFYIASLVHLLLFFNLCESLLSVKILNKYLLSAYYVAVTVLVTRDVFLNDRQSIGKIPALVKLTFV